MTKTSKTIIFFGNERIATAVRTDTPVLKALVNSGYKIAAVVANNSTAPGNSRELEIQKVAETHSIPLLLPTKLLEIKKQLESYNASIGVLVAYGKIVPQEIIDIFPSGIVNIHPSLLPKHRGPIPLESVLLGGEQKTGVSLMQLAKEMDAGPVYGQSEVALTGQETKQELADKLLSIGQSMLIELLPGILDGSIVALPQDSTHATYDDRLSKQDGIMDWKKSAKEIEREVRAFLGWPGSQTALAGKDVVITKAHVTDQAGEPGSVDISQKELIIHCGEQALVIDTLKPAGGKEMSGWSFVVGHKDALTA